MMCSAGRVVYETVVCGLSIPIVIVFMLNLDLREDIVDCLEQTAFVVYLYVHLVETCLPVYVF